MFFIRVFTLMSLLHFDSILMKQSTTMTTPCGIKSAPAFITKHELTINKQALNEQTHGT